MQQQPHRKNNTFHIFTPRLVSTICTTLIIVFFLVGTPVVHASATAGTIDSVHKYAWGNVAGYINFAQSHSTITVTDSKVSGYAWGANDGWINLSPTYGGVKNDGNGVLSGYAWDERAGWVDFSGVTINSSGVFHGKATGGVVDGANYIINFDCTSCDVRTDWRPASARVKKPINTPGAVGVTFINTAPTIDTISKTVASSTQTLPTISNTLTAPSTQTYVSGDVVSSITKPQDPNNGTSKYNAQPNSTIRPKSIPPSISKNKFDLGSVVHKTLLSVSIAAVALFVFLLFIFFF